MSSPSPFGQNEWLVEEMYRKFREDPSSVDPSWHEFLVDYAPEPAVDTGASTSDAAKPAPAGEPKTAAPAKSPPIRKAAPMEQKAAAAPAAPKTAASVPSGNGVVTQVLRGAAAAVVKNMSASLEVPTATSVRAIPAKAMIDNRIVINNHLKRTRGGKISFTHLLGYAIVAAVNKFPNMNRHFAEIDGKPNTVTPAHTNLGLAIDLPGRDGNRQLVVAAIKKTEAMRFGQFIAAYEDIVRRARDGKLTAEDFGGVTISLTNPGTIGTVHSVPRLMQGQGAIVGAGAMEYPAEFQGASEERICDLGVGKLMTLTSTYDHRIIQGAESGDFLRTIHQLLLDDEFYDEIFRELGIPYEPVRWRTDHPDSIDDKSARVIELIAAYRNRGHLMADIDPLRLDNTRFRSHPDLDVHTHGLTLWDLDREFKVNGFGGQTHKKLRDVLGLLRDSVLPPCRCGVHPHPGARAAGLAAGPDRGHAGQTHRRRAEVYSVQAQCGRGVRDLPGDQIRGAETVLAGRRGGRDPDDGRGDRPGRRARSRRGRHRDAAPRPAQRAGQHRRQAVLADLHRVRGQPEPVAGARFRRRQVPPRCAPAPTTRRSATRTSRCHWSPTRHTWRRSTRCSRVWSAPSRTCLPSRRTPTDPRSFRWCPMMLHGDAAFAGQGVVAETLNLALLRGYRTGGTIHIVVNNQIGFTTSPEHSRSSEYCTDVAKMIGAPIFHVNGEDPEACVWVAKLAMDFRQQFNKDVVIDMLCYRRRGHNEGDDPSMTQPAMYDVIDPKRGVRKTYTESLIGRGDISMTEAEDALRDYQRQLERVFNEVRELEKHPAAASESVESHQMIPKGLSTAVDKSLLARIGDAHLSLPEGFSVHPRVKPVLDRRREMAYEGKVDWALGELLALGSLVAEGKLVRFTGQDTRRGTFTQRHAVIIDRKTGQEFTPLQLLATNSDGTPTGGKLLVYDSPLSEYATVGFEYGYSVGNPDAMVLWEAQFGDFVDGAQSIIDEFISSGEAKWGQLSDVVLLLPHGHEGQGPDHTSGRIERFLQVCAEGSMTVAMPSTPANYFHLLRRHSLDGIQRPLIVFTPKSMLRSKAAVSSIVEFTEQKFRTVLEEPTYTDGDGDRSEVMRILLTSGKLYYDLAARKAKDNRDDVAIVRIEQLYPVPDRTLADTLDGYPNATESIWVQEEPANQGAWPTFGLTLPTQLPQHLSGITRVSRRAMSAPSSGSSKVHAVEQQELIDEAFGPRA